jgi:tetratricopeptide (TPR) repeat protein
MTARRLLLAVLLAAAASPVSASVVVVGGSAARTCYEAADSPLLPTAADLRGCDQALRDEALVRDDVVATHVNRGILRLRRNQIDAAIRDFDDAIALDPSQPEAYLNKGAALMRVENAGDALPLFTASLERNTLRPELAHFGRAIANETLGNLRAAYDDYRRASELSPNWQEPRTELARFRVVE